MCDILDQRIVKTRKHHCCFGCLASIPVGSTVERTTNVGSGEIYTNYLCEDCVEFSKTLPEEYRSFQCRKCWKPGGLVFKDYDDDGCHEDVEYRCVICGNGWIAEGSDY